MIELVVLSSILTSTESRARYRDALHGGSTIVYKGRKNYSFTQLYSLISPPAEKAFERVFEEVATVSGAAFETTCDDFTTYSLPCLHSRNHSSASES